MAITPQYRKTEMKHAAEPFAELIQNKIFNHAEYVRVQKSYFEYHTQLILQMADSQGLSEEDKAAMDKAAQTLQLALIDWREQMTNIYRESKRKLLNS